ncbi:hypothetical protein ACIRRH_02960 [Kitasatospora sp. NPDC101235]|uniref:hypothetical protein n=1 Tax=Kitasatospora sp. NPDC101235 TaxID=3364101 RepID=UPI0037FF1B65
MHAEWDHAHTDYGALPGRPSPAGLADTDADWYQRLEQTPNGWLLRDNSMLRSLAAGTPIHLLHLTRDLAAVRASGHLRASTGCLVGAVYGSPLTPVPGGGLRPHNLGSYLLESRSSLASRSNSTPLVIEVNPVGPASLKGLHYLRLGGVHLRAYREYRHVLTAAEDTQVLRSIVDRVRVAAPFLDALLHNASGKATPDGPFIDALAATVPVLPYLGYLYFETVAEYLMLHSTSRATREYADRGEMNHRRHVGSRPHRLPTPPPRPGPPAKARHPWGQVEAATVARPLRGVDHPPLRRHAEPIDAQFELPLVLLQFDR